MNPLPVPRRLTDFSADALALAPRLLGKFLCRRLADGTVLRRRITETEAYFGEEDTACHAHKGRTPRTDVLYAAGGCAYVYLCYGMHELFNVVTGPEGHPEAVLIRGVEGAKGPGRLTKLLHITRAFNRMNLRGTRSCCKAPWQTMFPRTNLFTCRHCVHILDSVRRILHMARPMEPRARSRP